jgi:hypothetical protein
MAPRKNFCLMRRVNLLGFWEFPGNISECQSQRIEFLRMPITARAQAAAQRACWRQLASASGFAWREYWLSEEQFIFLLFTAVN